MRHFLPFLILLGTASCSGPKTEGLDDAHGSTLPVLGDWRPAELPPGLPQECWNGEVQFQSDNTMHSLSGSQVQKADFTVEPEGEGFTLIQSNVTTNGEPNCQGLSAEFVVANWAHRVYIEVVGDTLRIYLGDKPSGQVYSLVRAHP